MPQIYINVFSEGEEGLYFRIRNWRDRMTKPLIAFLAKLGVTANMLSVAGLLMLLPFLYFFPRNAWLALLFLFFNTVFDLLDGSLARYIQKDGAKGNLLDFACDHIGFFIVFVIFLAYRFVDPFWGAIYLLNYPILLFLTLILRAAKVETGFVFRSKYYVYIFYFIWVVSGYLWMDIAVVLFTIYMIVENLFLLSKLKWTLL